MGIDILNLPVNFLIEVWSITKEMAPFLLFGFFMAGLLSILISPETVENHLGGKGILPSIKASVFGVPLPLCSCGVIPVAASLRKHGATKGATTAFIISTPQTGVDSILVTFSLLGPVFAIFRPVAALLSGLIGGLAVTYADSKNNSGNEQQNTPKCGSPCCAKHKKHGKIYSLFHYGFVYLPKGLAQSLIIGLIIAGAISVFLPKDFFAGYLGTGVTGMIVATLIGIPTYVCATASVPIALAMIEKGASPGVALVFLITGPATNSATISTIWGMMGKQTALIYLFTVGFTAFLSGYVMDLFFSAQNISQSAHLCAETLPDSAKIICTVFLAVILGYAFITRQKKQKEA